MPRLSVIMPVHNGASHLERAVRSTLDALPDDSELVVLDDGSTDATAHVLDRLSTDERLRVMHRAEAGGVASALNELLSSTDSEFVGRMDADDVTLRWRFARQLRILKRADVAFGGIVRINAEGRLLSADLPGTLSVQALPLHLLLASCVTHPTVTFRRSAIPDGGYRAIAAEDYDMWLRMAAQGRRMVRDTVPAIAYRLHAEQVTASQQFADERHDEHQMHAVFGSYAALIDRLRLSSESASLEILTFAMTVQRPPSTASVDAIRRFHEDIRAAAKSLSAGDRLLLNVRLKTLNARLG